MSVLVHYPNRPLPKPLVRYNETVLLADCNLPEGVISPLPLLAPKLAEGQHGFALPLLPVYRDAKGTYQTLNTELHPARQLTIIA